MPHNTSELWELRPTPLPPRTRLFHLAPIAAGTLFAESLMGYIVRLADYHCVTPSRLIRDEIAPCMMAKGFPKLNWRKQIERLFIPCSPLIRGNEIRGIADQTILLALEELTGQNGLSQLSLLHGASMLLTGSVLRRHQAWCPICLQQWLQAGCMIYTPLIWLLKSLGECPQHREQPLIDKCPFCHHSFAPLAPRSSPGFCPRCNGWLGSQKSQAVLDTNEEPASFDCSIFVKDSLERQLLWLDHSEELIEKAKLPFLPPQNLWA